jgi:hypothetical protein
VSSACSTKPELGSFDVSSFDVRAMRTLESAILKGHVVRAFLSGGGLRVVRIEKERPEGRWHTKRGQHDELAGYGKHADYGELAG